MEQAFKELYSGGRNTEGRNRFLYSVAEAQLRHILKNEMSHLERGERLTINGVEEKISDHPLLDGVTLKGKIDRVDTLDGCLRIIDYKTGKLEKKEITYHDGDEQMPGKWLQLMWYALLYSRKSLSTFHSPLSTLKVGIYPLRNLRSDVKLATWNDSEEITTAQLDSFESLLREKAEELMNPALPFIATPSAGACAYCPAKSYCNFCAK
jgi:RecB family exonuclease